MSCPRRLDSTCVEFIIENLHCMAVKINGRLQLIDGIHLPLNVCLALLRGFYEALMANNDTLGLFRDVHRTRLRHLNLRQMCNYADVSDDLFQDLMQHKPFLLDTTEMELISPQHFMRTIKDNCENLTTLCVEYRHVVKTLHSTSHDNGDEETRFAICPKLRHLGLHNVPLSQTYCEESDKVIHHRSINVKYSSGFEENVISQVLLSYQTQLVSLDLSNCLLSAAECNAIEYLPRLHTLILHKTSFNCEDAAVAIGHLTNLRFLDLSSDLDAGEIDQFENPVYFLSYIVHHLPNLVHLDLSGTNLAQESTELNLLIHGVPEVGDVLIYDVPIDRTLFTGPIPGLGGRRLKFLGLMLGTEEVVDQAHVIADKVASSGSEEHLICAMQCYLDRKSFVLRTLYDLYSLVRQPGYVGKPLLLELLIECLWRYPNEKIILVYGTASFFYLIKSLIKNNSLEKVTAKKIIRILMVVMENFPDEPVLAKNCLVSLDLLITQTDVSPIFKRLIRAIIRVMMAVSNESDIVLVRTLALHILNSLSCFLDCSYKVMMGEAGVVEALLMMIDRYKNRPEQIDVVQIAWSALWNITDETPQNSEKFIANKGKELFFKCVQLAFKTPQSSGIKKMVSSMMGMMGNVAEVETLRPALRQESFLFYLAERLDVKTNNLEISYNACGILSHLISDQDGVPVFPLQVDVIRCRMTAAIDSWPLDKKRSMSYRSFEPILRLLRLNGAVAAVHWGVWALCNMTNVYPRKYCALLEEEHGLLVLHDVLQIHWDHKQISTLALKIIEQCRKVKENPLDVPDESGDYTTDDDAQQ